MNIQGFNDFLMDDEPGAAGGGAVDETEETVETPEGETTDEVTDDEVETLSEEELKEAKALYGLLKNKDTQVRAVTQLAERAGILNRPLETQKQVTTATKDLKSLVKEKLGPEMAFLADKLGDVLETVLEQERAQNKTTIDELSSKNVERETSDALEKLNRETKGDSFKHEQKMLALMDKINPSPGTSVYEYLNMLYKIASSDKAAATARSQMSDRIRKNAKDAPGRLASTSSGGTPKGDTPIVPAKKGIGGAVEAALAQLEKGSK